MSAPPSGLPPYDDTNIFARILRGEIPSKRVHEDEHAVAFHDINPQAPVHVLVVPKEHHDDIREIADADDELVGDIVRAASAVAASEHIDDAGFRLVFNTGAGAGQTVFHAHGHVLGGRRLGHLAG